MTRIVGGWKVEENTYPWQVFIEHPSKPSTGPSCGGSLITNQHVITARHCVDETLFDTRNVGEQELRELLKFLQKYPWYFRVSLGDHHWRDNKFKFVTVSKITLHEELDNEPCGGGHDYGDHSEYPGFDYEFEGYEQYEHEFEENHSDYLEYDVAILTLSQKIKLNDKISPICLPANNRKTSYARRNGQVSGWGIDKDNYNSITDGAPGQPHELLVANVNILSDEACKKVAKEHSHASCPPYDKCGHNDGDLTCEYLQPEEMCSMEHGSTCNGDSGGPLFLKEMHSYKNPKAKHRWIAVERYNNVGIDR